MKLFLQIWAFVSLVYAIMYFTEGNTDALKEAIGSILLSLIFLGYINYNS